MGDSMISQWSRYRYNRQLYDDNGALYLDEREPVRYAAQYDDRLHQVQDGDTLWGLAYLYFQGIPRASGLWWVIAEYQPEPIVDPTIVLEVGSTVIIPSLRFVRTKIFNEDQQRYH